MYRIALILKCFLWFLGKWDVDLSWLPYFSNPYTQYINIREAKYLIDNNYNPYSTDGIFQKPLIVYGLIIIDSDLVFLITDILLSFLVVYLFGAKQGYRKSILLFYHLNPITFANIILKNTNVFDHLFMLLTIFSALKIKFLSPILFGFLLYLNPQYFIIFAAISVIFRRESQTTQKFALKLIAFLLISALTIWCLLHLSYLITGDWQFIEKTYIDFYFPKDHKPTIGFLWALFSGLFSKYKQLYHAFFILLPVCYILPLYNLFVKYAKREKDYLGFMIGVSLFCSFLYFQYIAISDLVIIFILLFQRYDWLFNSLPTIVIIHAGCLILFLGGGLQFIWTHSFTGNPNFTFFQVFVSYVFYVILVSEGIREMLKFRTIQKKEEKEKIKEAVEEEEQQLKDEKKESKQSDKKLKGD
ncbi:unnamed protein product [Paramecium sonneborni]|uniref:GPI transamidase subunit PIG-U n=1 Tax=Paramecium sonneborni TaxID=65129 RepID=A0A8S1KXY6_9CILI|nr:unnamed protein product [Paramecium sonneborni]